MHASPGPSGVRQDSHSSVSQSSSRLSDTASLTDVRYVPRLCLAVGVGIATS